MTRIGIIGLGFMGRVHYDTYSKVDGAEVVAVCDADPKRAAGDLSDTWGNVDKGSTRQLPMDRIQGTCDWRELITVPQVDVIDICVPTPAHVEVATAALATGKHVVCEKPLARTSADARAIASAAASARGMFMPAMCMRFWPEWEWIKQAADQGRYGRVQSAHFRRVGSIPGGWFRNGKLSGGALLDLHVHDTDFVYHLFGRPRAVFSQGHVGQSGEVDHVVTQYQYATGGAAGGREPAAVVAEGSWTAAEGFGFRMQATIHFERATVDYDFGRKDGALMVYAEGKATPVEVAKHDGYVGEMNYLLECIRSGRKPTRVTAEDAVAGIEIVEAEKRSIETGQPVRL
jgi:predicted dehydrogenase